MPAAVPPAAAHRKGRRPGSHPNRPSTPIRSSCVTATVAPLAAALRPMAAAGEGIDVGSQYGGRAGSGGGNADQTRTRRRYPARACRPRFGDGRGYSAPAPGRRPRRRPNRAAARPSSASSSSVARHSGTTSVARWSLISGTSGGAIKAALAVIKLFRCHARASAAITPSASITTPLMRSRQTAWAAPARCPPYAASAP